MQRHSEQEQRARRHSELNVRCVRQFSYDLDGKKTGMKFSSGGEGFSSGGEGRFVAGAYRQLPKVHGFHPTVGLLCDAVLEDTFERLLGHEQTGHGHETLTAPGLIRARAPDHSQALDPQASPAAISSLYAYESAASRRAVGGSSPRKMPGGSSVIPANVWSQGGAGFLPGNTSRCASSGWPVQCAVVLSDCKGRSRVPREYRQTRFYFTESVHNVVLQESNPAQIRQLILYHYKYKE